MKSVVKKKKSAYEEGNVEDRDSGHCEHSDGGTDRDGNNVVHEHVHALVIATPHFVPLGQRKVKTKSEKNRANRKGWPDFLF